jgi:histone acetyltransferase (RNA polymerase elongator complex component)
VERVTTYGRASTLARYSVGQLKLLRESGLNRVHTGFESGSDQVLAMINKGLTQEQQIEAGRKTVEAGIELSVYFMPGIGGRRYSQENADETAYVVNQIRPDFVRLRTFILKLESEMYEMKRRGEFEECTDLEKLGEIRRLIAGIDAPETRIVSDHIVNLIGTLSGRIGTDKEAMLAQADEVLSLPVTEQRIYQNFRRHGLVDNYLQMKTQVSPQQFEHMRQYAEGFESDEDWEDYMNEILRQYV